MDHIEQAIKLAEDAARAGTTAPAAGLPATQQGGSNVVAFVPPTGARAVLTADDMTGRSFSVDAFIKVSEDGIKIGDKPGLIESLDVKIDLAEVMYYFGIKYGKDPVTYEKTTDRVTTFSGKSWGQVLSDATRVEGSSFRGEYSAADVPFVLLSDAKDIKGAVVAEAGTRVGKSLSTTEWREWESLINQVKKLGMDHNREIITMKIGFKARSNQKNQKWGVLSFTCTGAYDDDQQAAA
jgi:hypothetical protein